MNTDENGPGTLPVGQANPIIQFYKVIVVAYHDRPQPGAVQFVANAFSRVERQVLFPQKDRRPSSANPPLILSAVTGVNHHCRKMPDAGRRVGARRLSATA